MAAIGVMDSGVGGIYVLHKAYRLMPGEDYVFYADLGNAPYGSRPQAEIERISMAAARHLVDQGVKALLVACNTATSAAVSRMREEFSLPVVGVEPALKPAMEARRGGKIAVMATPATLRLPKFRRLMERCGLKEDLVPLPCPGLSLMVERCGPGSPVIAEYLGELFSHTELERLDAVVLGCTHYSYLAGDIKRLLGEVLLFDGAQGAVRQLKRVLEERNLLAETKGGRIAFQCSGGPEGQELMTRFWQIAEADDHD
jgi:glutamate racemase